MSTEATMTDAEQYEQAHELWADYKVLDADTHRQLRTGDLRAARNAKRTRLKALREFMAASRRWWTV